jgi:hypothetical protein
MMKDKRQNEYLFFIDSEAHNELGVVLQTYNPSYFGRQEDGEFEASCSKIIDPSQKQDTINVC